MWEESQNLQQIKEIWCKVNMCKEQEEKTEQNSESDVNRINCSDCRGISETRNSIWELMNISSQFQRSQKMYVSQHSFR